MIVMGATTYEWIVAHLAESGEGWPYPMPAWVVGHRELAGIEGADIRFAQGDVAPLHDEPGRRRRQGRLGVRRRRPRRPVRRGRQARPGDLLRGAGDARRRTATVPPSLRLEAGRGAPAQAFIAARYGVVGPRSGPVDAPLRHCEPSAARKIGGPGPCDRHGLGFLVALSVTDLAVTPFQVAARPTRRTGRHTPEPPRHAQRSGTAAPSARSTPTPRGSGSRCSRRAATRSTPRSPRRPRSASPSRTAPASAAAATSSTTTRDAEGADASTAARPHRRDAARRLHRPGNRAAVPVHPRPGHQRRLRRRPGHARHLAGALDRWGSGRCRGARAGSGAGPRRLQWSTRPSASRPRTTPSGSATFTSTRKLYLRRRQAPGRQRAPQP